jgi:hypothetical protein
MDEPLFLKSLRPGRVHVLSCICQLEMCRRMEWCLLIQRRGPKKVSFAETERVDGGQVLDGS